MKTPKTREPMIALAALLSWAAPAMAEPTPIAVRAVAKGAKFIGTSMGGVLITVEDVRTGELLAKGVVAGTTGDTKQLMTEPLPRGAPRSTPEASVFQTFLDVEQPREVRIVARGPLAQPQAMAEVSTTLWVAPGMPVTGGDGIVLEFPGFAVDVLEPRAHGVLEAGGTARVHANVVMMCGCPIQPGGLWDADEMRFVAYVYRDGAEVGRVPARYAGAVNQFVADVPVRKPGAYVVTFVAHDPRDGNTGADSVGFIVR